MLKSYASALALVIVFAGPLTTSAHAQTGAGAAQQPTERVRGVIEQADARSLTVRDRSGEVVKLVRPADMNVSEVVPLTLADIRPDSYVGVGAIPQPDGTQRALVTFKPGNQDQAALVVPGAKVIITAQEKGGRPTALRMLVGRNGFQPPM